MGIPEMTSYQMWVSGFSLGVLDAKKVENHWCRVCQIQRSILELRIQMVFCAKVGSPKYSDRLMAVNNTLNELSAHHSLSVITS